MSGVSRQRIDEHGAGMANALLSLSAATDAERQQKIVTASDRNLWQATMSPNGRWIAFVAGLKGVLRVATLGSKDGQWNEPQDERAWKYVDDDPAAQDKPHWSPDGRLLYFTSTRGGLTNIWAVDFDAASGTTGAPFRVTTFSGPGEQIPADITTFDIGVGRGGLAIPTLHPAGAIWLQHPAR